MSREKDFDGIEVPRVSHPRSRLLVGRVFVLLCVV